MAVRCAELMEIHTFQQLKLVGGYGGLDRVVRCPYVALTNTIDKWVHGGEFMFVSGIDLKCDEDSLYNLLIESNKKKLSGVVILISSGQTEGISPRLIELADQFCLPLFEMPYNLPLVEITEEISSLIIQTRLKEQFVNELMLMFFDRNGIDIDTIISRAAFYHYDLSGSHQIAIVTLQNIQSIFWEHESFLVEKAMKYMESLRSFIDVICQRNGWKVLSMINCGSVILLLPTADRQAIAEMLCEIKKHIAASFDSPCIQIGVGQEYGNLKDMKQSRLEAERAILAVQQKEDEIVFYQDIGIYKVLFEIGNDVVMQAYYEEVLGKVLQYDKENHTHLMQTLTVYLEENCNLVRTAERLYIHRNSLVYRIRKLEEVTGYDFSLTEIRERCRYAILVGNFLSIKVHSIQ